MVTSPVLAFTVTISPVFRNDVAIFVPTMHGSMQNSIYQENIDKLVSKGVEVIEPVYKYGKANLPDLMYIVNQTVESIEGRIKWKR